jgi:lipoprotein-releasing system permease protein
MRVATRGDVVAEDGEHRGAAQLDLLGHAVGALGRRGLRTVTLLTGLVAAVAVLSAVSFVTAALRAEASRARASSPDLVVQKLVGGRPSLVEVASAPPLAALPGVESARSRVWGYLFLASIQGNVTVVGASEPPSPGAVAVEGRWLRDGERGACVLGRDLARVLGLSVGDRLRLPAPDERGTTLSIVGLFSSEVGLFTSDVALVHEDDARLLLDLPPGQATDIAVRLVRTEESEVVAEEARERIPGARVLEKRLLERVHALTYGRRAGFVLGASIPALLSLLALAIDRAAGLGAAERREIAVLKACGWSTADVLAAKVYESALVALLGSGLGLFAGYAWAFWLGAPGLREVLAGWSTLYPRVALTPDVTSSELFAMLTVVSAPYVALSVVPSWRAAILDPLEALRG